MITTKIELLKGGRTRRVALLHDSIQLRYDQVIEAWCSDAQFREYFISLLVAAPFEAYFWEAPCVTSDSRDRPFEFVLVDSPTLAGVSADQDAFRAHFEGSAGTGGACTFSNLGGDAELVAPSPMGADSTYAHLAAFSRSAPIAQQHAFWIEVGRALDRTVGPQPTWVSTSGLGIYWLHVRLDSWPKYYTFAPFRESG